MGKQAIHFEQDNHWAYTIGFGVSDVCYQGYFLEFQNSWHMLTRFYSALLVQEEAAPSPGIQSCDTGQQHLKLKYNRVTSEQKNDFVFDHKTHKTIIELNLITDTKVTLSKRSQI